MSVRRAWRAVANETGEVARNLRRADKAAAALEKRGGTAVGGSPGGVGPQFQASTVAPPGGGVAPAGGAKGARLGGGGGSGAEGVKTPEGNRGNLAAIVEAAGVAAPPRNEWAPNGLPDAPPGFIVATVLSLGTSAPVHFLIWCAGLLAYTNVDEASATASRHGGGFRAGKKSRFREFVLEGGQASGLHFVDPTNRTGILDSRLDPTRSQGQITTGPTSQGISASQASSIASSTQQSANLLGQLVSQVAQLNANLSSAAGGVAVRAGKG